MTRIVFRKKDGKYYCLDVRGHAMYNTEGPDILCSSISMMTQACANYITKDIPNYDRCFEYDTDDRHGVLYFELKTLELIDDAKTQIAFEMTYDALVDIAQSDEFRNYMKVEVFEYGD